MDPEVRHPARAGGVRIETTYALTYTSGTVVTPPARAGCGLKLAQGDYPTFDFQSPRPRGRGAD